MLNKKTEENHKKYNEGINNAYQFFFQNNGFVVIFCRRTVYCIIMLSLFQITHILQIKKEDFTIKVTKCTIIFCNFPRHENEFAHNKNYPDSSNQYFVSRGRGYRSPVPVRNFPTFPHIQITRGRLAIHNIARVFKSVLTGIRLRERKNFDDVQSVYSNLQKTRASCVVQKML